MEWSHACFALRGGRRQSGQSQPVSQSSEASRREHVARLQTKRIRQTWSVSSAAGRAQHRKGDHDHDHDPRPTTHDPRPTTHDPRPANSTAQESRTQRSAYLRGTATDFGRSFSLHVVSGRQKRSRSNRRGLPEGRRSEKSGLHVDGRTMTRPRRDGPDRSHGPHVSSGFR